MGAFEFKTTTNTKENSQHDITGHGMPANIHMFIVVDEIGKEGFLVRKVYATPNDQNLLKKNLPEFRIKNEVWPEKFGMIPIAPNSKATVAEHVYSSKQYPSTYVSTSSEFPDGATRFQGKTVYIDIEKAKAAGAKLVTTEEILIALEDYKAVAPHKTAKINEISNLVKDFDKEVLVKRIKRSKVMSILQRIRQIFNPEPKKQVLGYSPTELQLLFQNSSVTVNPDSLGKYPEINSLDAFGIHAFYVSLLIDKREIENFLQQVDSYFLPETNRMFNDLAVAQCKGRKGNERLCYLISDEFENLVIRLVTDSEVFLNSINGCDLSVPPPWIAFKNYNPRWWGGNMQGAQEYYDDNFFCLYFKNLNREQRENYYIKYDASQDWKKALELFYDIEDDEASSPID